MENQSLEQIRKELLAHEQADEKNMASLATSIQDLSREFHLLNISLTKLASEVSSRNAIIDAMDKKIEGIRAKIETDFVRKEIFIERVGRLEKIVYGTIGTILIAVVTAVISLVIRK